MNAATETDPAITGGTHEQAWAALQRVLTPSLLDPEACLAKRLQPLHGGQLYTLLSHAIHHRSAQRRMQGRWGMARTAWSLTADHGRPGAMSEIQYSARLANIIVARWLSDRLEADERLGHLPELSDALAVLQRSTNAEWRRVADALALRRALLDPGAREALRGAGLLRVVEMMTRYSNGTDEIVIQGHVANLTMRVVGRGRAAELGSALDGLLGDQPSWFPAFTSTSSVPSARPPAKAPAPTELPNDGKDDS
ncbi:hypothetical protein [Kitasatospora sp. NPDC004289]